MIRKNPSRPLLHSARDWIYWRTVILLRKLRHLKSDKSFTKWRFRKVMGYELNLDTPRTFNEKIQWLKLNDRRPVQTTCSDKVSVCDFIKDEWGPEYLIPTLAIYQSADEIDPASLPDTPFVIKPSHDQGSAIIVHDKADHDWDAVRERLKKALRNNDYWKEREWQYRHIPPQIIVQKALLDANANPPPDFKFHCMNGSVKMIHVDQDRFGSHRRVLYKQDWTVIDGAWQYPKGEPIAPPEKLTEMISLAEKIAHPFDYIRVDFYLHEGQLFFGELTFTPGAGLDIFDPPELDTEIGAMLTLTGLNDQSPA